MPDINTQELKRGDRVLVKGHGLGRYPGLDGLPPSAAAMIQPNDIEYIGFFLAQGETYITVCSARVIDPNGEEIRDLEIFSVPKCSLTEVVSV